MPEVDQYPQGSWLVERQIGIQVVTGTLARLGWQRKGFGHTLKGQGRCFQIKTFNEGLALAPG